MTCNCKSDIEAKLLEALKNMVPGRNHEAVLQGYGINLSGPVATVRPFMMAHGYVEPERKAGGYSARRTIKQTVVFTFCPFCGSKFQ